MNHSTTPPREITPQVRQAIVKWIVRASLGAAVYALLLFLPAGRLDWMWGWVMLGVLVAVMVAHPLIILPFHPDLLVEREKGFWHEGVKAWDKWLTTLAGGLMPLPWIIAGLDVRFGWTGPLPLGLHLAGLLVADLGYGLFLGAMGANAYFSGGVRIQAERGHTVVTGGPYRWVRHPGYLGTILVPLGAAFLLGSPWALAPAGLSAVVFIIRTWLEDRTLAAELPGYKAYTEQTRWRLLPGLW